MTGSGNETEKTRVKYLFLPKLSLGRNLSESENGGSTGYRAQYGLLIIGTDNPYDKLNILMYHSKHDKSVSIWKKWESNQKNIS